jgi:tmRNA-binding protein
LGRNDFAFFMDNKYIYSVFIFQAEIKRMREANKAASRERQLLLQQREEINRLRQSTKQVKGERTSRF